MAHQPGDSQRLKKENEHSLPGRPQQSDLLQKLQESKLQRIENNLDRIGTKFQEPLEESKRVQSCLDPYLTTNQMREHERRAARQVALLGRKKINLTQPQSIADSFVQSAEYFRDAVQERTTPMVEEGRWEDKERFLEEAFAEFEVVCDNFRQRLLEDLPADEVQDCCTELIT